MADYYCDHGAYPTYAAVPTWGVPQDGDGTSTGVAASSATCSIDLTSASASSGNTFSVMGAAFSCVASGATNNQFNAGSGATLAANLAAAINRAGNTNYVTAQAAGWPTPKPQDAMYARSTGATLEIMTRAGSATYNGLTACTHVSFTGWPGNPTWSGGSGGAWGYLFNGANHGTLWPSALASGGYGCLVVGPGSSANLARLLAGAYPVAPDVVWARANNRVITFNNTKVDSISDWRLIVDCSNVKWAGTSGKTLALGAPTVSSYENYWRLNKVNGRHYIAATAYCGLEIFHECNSGSTGLTIGARTAGPTLTYENVQFRFASSQQLVPFTGGFSGNSRNYTAYRCKFLNTYSAVPLALTDSYSGGVSGSFNLLIDRCEFVFTAFSGTGSGLIGIPGVGSYKVTNSELIGSCVMPVFRASPGSNSFVCIAENLKGFSLNLSMGLTSLATNDYGAGDPCTVLQQNIDGGFRFESPTMMIDYIPGANPTCTSQMLDGTAWSWRMQWYNSVYIGYTLSVNIGPVLTKRSPTTTASTRTIGVEFYAHASLLALMTNKNIALDVTYTDSGGATRNETTRLENWIFTDVAPTAVAASSETWNANGVSGYSAGKLTLTTAYAVKANTDVVAKVVLLATNPTAYSSIYVDPDLRIV